MVGGGTKQRTCTQSWGFIAGQLVRWRLGVAGLQPGAAQSLRERNPRMAVFVALGDEKAALQDAGHRAPLLRLRLGLVNWRKLQHCST